MNHPILKQRNFLIFAAAWIIVILLDISFLIREFELPLSNAIYDALVFDLILCGLSLAYWFPARFISIDNNSLFMLVLKHLGAAIFATLVWSELSTAILKFILSTSNINSEFLKQTLGWRFSIGIGTYIIIVSLYYLYIYYNNFQEKLIYEAELKSLIKEAELKSLKYQINPHFIFNSLNSISSLTMINPDKARDMTIKLSSYMRYTLANNEKQFNSLKDEINNAKLYLEIERIRFNDKFEFIDESENSCLNIPVPSMILQPLLENAIKYGVYESINKVSIKLTCQTDQDFLSLSVENNFEDENSQLKGEKIGLKNIKNRLKLIYKQENLLKIEKKENIFTVKIFIPLNHET